MLGRSVGQPVLLCGSTPVRSHTVGGDVGHVAVADGFGKSGSWVGSSCLLEGVCEEEESRACALAYLTPPCSIKCLLSSGDNFDTLASSSDAKGLCLYLICSLCCTVCVQRILGLKTSRSA